MAKIEREAQYEWAVKRVEALLPLVGDDAPEDDPARIELELLSELVLGISPSRLSDLLAGKCEPTIKTARTISRKLDIDAAIVLGV